LESKAMKVYEHPGVAIAANKTFTYVIPTLRHRYDEAWEFANTSHTGVYNRLNAYIGNEKVEPYLPLMSGILVYGLLMIPLCCTISCLLRGLKVACGKQEMLLFGHVYFSLTNLCAAVFAAITGQDALVAFAMHDASVYMFSQYALVVLLLCYTWNLIMSTICGRGREPYWRTLQIGLLTPVLLAYFFHVWTPMMLDQMPTLDRLVFRVVGKSAISHMVWAPYVPAALIFLAQVGLEVMCFRARKHDFNLQRAEAVLRVRGLEELESLVGKRGDVEMGKMA